MANAYKIAQVELNAANTDFTVLSGTAATTLVKGVYFSHEDHNTVVQLCITKHNGSRITVREVDHVAGEMTQLLPDTMALEANDSIKVQSNHIAANDVGYVTVNYVESTTGVTAQSIGVLNDVDVTSTAPTDGQVLVWNDSDGEFQPGNAGGSTATLDDIGNVDTTGKATNAVLLWNGSNWVDSNRLTTLYGIIKEGNSTTLTAGADTSSQLELTSTTSKLKTGVTGVEITETSPGEIDFVVAAGTSGNEAAFTAAEIHGATATNVANFNIKNGTSFYIYGASGGARLQYSGSGAAITLPATGGTLAKTTDIATDAAVAANTLKVGITSQQVADITANNAKVGITTSQANAITANSAKISYTDASAVAANTAKNSYPSADASKLAGIAAGAEVNVNADWNATSGDAQILNKPSIPSNTNLGNTNLTADNNRTYDQDGNDLIINPRGGQFEINDSSGSPNTSELTIGQGEVFITGTSVSINDIDYPTTDGTNGQVLTTNGSGALSFTTVSGGGGSGGIGTADQTLTADRTIDTNGFNLDIELDSSGTADTFTIHDGTHDLFQVDTTTTGTLFSVNDVSGLPKLEVDVDEGVIAKSIKVDDSDLTAAGQYGKGAEVWYQGTSTPRAGDVYYLNSSGDWANTDASAVATSKGMLSVAVGIDSDVNGMVIKGFVYLATDPGGSVGDVVYLSETTNKVTSTAPITSAAVVRVCGYKVATNVIYFNPSQDWIELS